MAAERETFADDPYRVVFDQLSAGAARCRLLRTGGQVVSIEVVDSNAAMLPLRDVLSTLYPVFARVVEARSAEKLRRRHATLSLAISVHPVGDDEVMVIVDDVTVREELEARSRVSQSRFEQAFNNNAAAMVIAQRADLRIVDVNPRWLEMFGATRGEVIGKTSMELGLISEDNARTRIAQHVQFSEGYDIELELRTRAGGKLTVLASAKPIILEDGPCTLTTLIDITGRKHAEEAFAVAFNASPAGMVLSHIGSNLMVSVNERIIEMTGWSRDELIGHGFEHVQVVQAPLRAELIEKLRRDGRLDGVEVQLTCKHGGTLATQLSTQVITLNDAAHRLTVFTDISARKMVERRLLAQHQIGVILAEASELEPATPPILEALCRAEGWDCGAMWLPPVDGGPLTCVGVWHCLGETAALELVTRGATPGSATVGMISRVLSSGAAEMISLGTSRSELGAAAAAAGLRAGLAFPVLRGSQVLGVVALAGRTARDPLTTDERGLYDSIGRLLGFFVERMRAETRLRELNADLEDRVDERTEALANSNRDLEAFTSSVSHDLRAPLRTMHGFSEILLEEFASQLPDEAKLLLERIHASGGRLRNLIDELLAFSRLGRGGMRRERIEVAPLVRSVVDEVLGYHPIRDRLYLTIGDLGSCHADSALLRAVWTNLLDNAFKYSRTRPRIIVEVGRERRDDETVYFVQDNGVGFDPQYAERLFGVFQRLHSATDFEGTGIGLANVRRIIEWHHGRVSASTVQGQGSRFEFTLGKGGLDDAKTSDRG